MARKKAVPVEEQDIGMETFGLPEAEHAEGTGEIPEGAPEAAHDDGELPEGLPPFAVGVNDSSSSSESTMPCGDNGDTPATPPEDSVDPKPSDGSPLPGPSEVPEPPGPTDAADTPNVSEYGEAMPLDGADLPVDVSGTPGVPEVPETPEVPEEVTDAPPAEAVGGSKEAPPPKSDRQSFFDLDSNDLDRDLTAEERQEWNSIYASYRGRSALTGTIIGVDPHSISVRSRETGQMERQTMYCAIVIPYRVRVVIPASEMWEAGHERPDFVLQNMVGASIDFIIIKVDRESGFAIGSRRLAARSQRYFFAHRPSLCQEGARLKCRLLSVGPRRCLVECYGHDIGMTQRDLRYTAIPDLRDEYRPGQELDCVVKSYDTEKEVLRISVKETESNPFEGAELRHPAGSRRQAVIAGKYGGSVFCNLPDGAVCMCSYSYQHEDSDFLVGDTVILVVQRHEREKRQIYGKILSKW